MKSLIFTLLLCPFLFSEDARVIAKPDGIIPVSIYDPLSDAGISESALLDRIHQACLGLQEDPQDYSEYLFAFFKDYPTVPKQYQGSLVRDINQCGINLKNHFNAQSPWKRADIPAIPEEFLSSWGWAIRERESSVVRRGTGERAKSLVKEQAEQKPIQPVSVRTKPERAPSSIQEASRNLKARMEGSVTTPSLEISHKPALSVSLAPGSGYSITPNKKDQCPVDKDGITRCNMENESVQGAIARPDGEYVGAITHEQDKCAEELRKSVDEIVTKLGYPPGGSAKEMQKIRENFLPASRQTSGLAMTDEQGEPWEDPKETRVLMDQYLQCQDPCLTEQEREALLDDNCTQDCLHNIPDKDKARGSIICRRCWTKLGVRPGPRYKINPATGQRECLAYAKPAIPLLPPKPKPKPPLLATPTPKPSPPTSNHTLSAKEIADKSDKIVKLAELSKATGGQVSEVKSPQDTSDAIKSRLTLPVPQKHYQVLFLIDASGSMQAHVEDLKSKVPELISYAKAQLKDNGQVSFAVRYYVDTTSERPVPLDSENVLEVRAKQQQNQPLTQPFPPRGEGKYTQQEANEAIKGLDKAIHHIETIAGSLEYHWEETVKAIDGEPWALPSSPDIEKVIFLITDEPGDIGTKRYTQQDAISKAKSKGIRYEIIMYKTEGMGGRACTPQDKPTLHAYNVTVDYGRPLTSEPANEEEKKGALESAQETFRSAKDTVKSWFTSDKPPDQPKPDKPKISAIQAGSYDYAHSSINSTNFPDSESKKYIPSSQQQSEIQTQLTLFNFQGCVITSEEALKRMDSLGYRPANLYELLAIGAKEKDLQRQFPMVSLGSSWLDSVGRRNVPSLLSDGAERKLYLYWGAPSREWRDDWRFGAVRK